MVDPIKYWQPCIPLCIAQQLCDCMLVLTFLCAKLVSLMTTYLIFISSVGQNLYTSMQRENHFGSYLCEISSYLFRSEIWHNLCLLWIFTMRYCSEYSAKSLASMKSQNYTLSRKNYVLNRNQQPRSHILFPAFQCCTLQNKSNVNN